MKAPIMSLWRLNLNSLWALKLLNQSWPHFWVMVNPFQGSEGSSNNDWGTF
jgi:hypothetical protein